MRERVLVPPKVNEKRRPEAVRAGGQHRDPQRVQPVGDGNLLRGCIVAQHNEPEGAPLIIAERGNRLFKRNGLHKRVQLLDARQTGSGALQEAAGRGDGAAM